MSALPATSRPARLSPVRLSPARLSAALGLPAPTAQQVAVIEAGLSPSLVVAGAGAGKTETMAARVVWLVANDHVRPEQVLGLTFTRKAAQQLAARIRGRLRVLADSAVLDEVDPTGGLRDRVRGGEPEVSTYHAYAGRLLAEHGLRLPVEPTARLLGETASWQVAHRVVSTWSDPLDIDLTPATVVARVRGLAGQLAEHLVDAEQLRDAHRELEHLVATLPRGPGQRAAPTVKLLEIIAAQQQRLTLLPLLDRLAETMRRESSLDFGSQMSLAATVARDHPEVGLAERSRFRAVLLDEYQDTGHAQRVLLRALFGAGVDPSLALTAVGDPIQSIYGWRGASAANLPRFAADFPLDAAGTPAPRRELLTSWRNPPEALALANGISAQLRATGVPVSELQAKPAAQPGLVRLALTNTVAQELAWLAGHVRRRYDDVLAQTTAAGARRPPTAAVLVRRRSDMAAVADALRAEGLPVEIVGLGGLLDTPEVRDVVSVLRLLADPLAGTAATRVLTGARWQLGAADLAALWRRARELAIRGGGTELGEAPDEEALRAALASAHPGEHAEQAGLADALADPGRPARYSADGWARITAVADELASLRERIGQPLPELVAEVERTLRVDVEVSARPGGVAVGRAHLDAFADVVVSWSSSTSSPTLPGLLGYLAAAEDEEDGLSPGEVEVDPDRVQVLTVHAAKGLEWEVVAVPHLNAGVFPAGKRSSSWLRNPVELPPHLRGDAADPTADPSTGAGVGVPVLDLSGCTTRKDLETVLAAHESAVDARRREEERRLLYVALTRTEHTLLLSGSHWGATGSRPRVPSEFLVELRGLVEGVGGAGGAGTVEEWAAVPEDGAVNPASEQVRSARWPVDPLGERRAAVTAGAQLVRDALVDLAVELHAATDDHPADDERPDDPDGWVTDVDALLAERERRRSRVREVELPAQLSVSQLVALRRDPVEFAARLRRPLPYPPSPLARRGTEFHAWVERRFGATRLLDLDDLPGAGDEGAAPDADLAALQAAFLRSPWAERRPVEVEVPFETELAGTVVRGRIDAVFGAPGERFTVVDWKTGAVPDAAARPALLVQLAAYRLAWAELAGVAPEQVDAVFVYVRHDHTLAAPDLLDAAGLRALLADATAGPDPDQDSGSGAMGP